MNSRLQEANEFYQSITPRPSRARMRKPVMRQALAGMLWSKQYYFFDLDKWLEERGVNPLLPASANAEQGMVPHGERSHHFHAG